MPFRILGVIGFVVSTVAAFATPALTPPPALTTVFASKVGHQSIFNVLTFPARVESKINATVRTESDGIIAKILRPLGSRVQRGEAIAMITHTDPVYEFEPLAVVAPVAGVVNDVSVTPGSLVNKGDPIATVTDPAQIRVIIEVAALDVHFVRAGMTGDLSISGLTQPVAARVRGVSPSVDPLLGTATCELLIVDAKASGIVPGMVGKVQFKVNEHQGILVPDYAVVYRGDKTFLRVIDNGHAKRIPVQLGEKRQGQVEILSGLNDGDEVISRTSRFVAEGEAVQVEHE